MKDDVINRLQTLGYTATSEDDFLLEYLSKKVTEEIENKCNINGIPEGLYRIAVDMVCGELLQTKASIGQLDSSAINTEAAIKTIKEGDTSITYARAEGGGGTSFDGLIDYLLNYGKSQFVTFRRIKW